MTSQTLPVMPPQPLETEPPELACLSRKQRRYVDGRAQGMSPSAAARMAGYSFADVNVTRVTNSPKIIAALELIAKNNLARMNITKQDVLDGLMDAVRAASTSMELTAAWREIGKITGSYEPQKVEIEVKDLTTARLQKMSDKDLLLAIQQGGVAEMLKQAEDQSVVDGEFRVLADAVQDAVPLSEYEDD